MLVFIGTYTNKASRGVYGLRLDPAGGGVSEAWLAVEARNPTFLALAPGGRHLYATGEVPTGRGDGSFGGGVGAYAIDGVAGRLALLNQKATGGPSTTHGVVDGSGRSVVTVSYQGGYACALPILPDGSLGEPGPRMEHRGPVGPVKDRQDRPHPHSAAISPDNRFVLVCDLGLDRVYAYGLDPARALLTPGHPPFAAAPPGAGPRHGKFSSDSRFFYVLNELGGIICVYAFDPVHGVLALRQTISTLPDGFQGANGTAEIRIHPNGRFVYASNRGHDSLAAFARDPESGTLELIGIVPSGGRHPRNFALTPDGKWLLCANRDTDNVVVFAVDAASGRLTPTGGSIPVPEPVCVLFA